jgi:hypothetical protein
MLQMMGQSEAVPGAIVSGQVAAALANLKRASAQVEKQVSAAPQQKHGYDMDEPVSLALRAQPLIELLVAAEKEKCDVMWDK